MLVISRKRDEKIILAGDIEITVLEIGRSRVRLGIKAPKHIPIDTRFKTSPILGETEVTEVVATPSRVVSIKVRPAAAGASKAR